MIENVSASINNSNTFITRNLKYEKTPDKIYSEQIMNCQKLLILIMEIQ